VFSFSGVHVAKCERAMRSQKRPTTPTCSCEKGKMATLAEIAEGNVVGKAKEVRDDQEKKAKNAALLENGARRKKVVKVGRRRAETDPAGLIKVRLIETDCKCLLRDNGVLRLDLGK